MADETTEATVTEENPRRSRRNMLKLAGVAAGAGAVALVARPGAASAADGDNIVIGTSNSGSGTNGTSLTDSNSSAATLMVQSTGGGSAAILAEGVLSDVKLSGTGILQFVGGTASGNAQPTTSPAARGMLQMSTSGILWAGSNHFGDWRRINAVRFDAASGSGSAFSPGRLIDTRSTSRLSANTSRNVAVAGHLGVPSDAIAIFGNLTAVAPNHGTFGFSAFMSVYPTGVTQPTVSNLNMTKGDQFAANFFCCGLGTSGQLTVFTSETTDFLIDIFAYVQ